MRLTLCSRGGGKNGPDADRHLHSRLRLNPGRKTADLEPGAALFRAAGPAQGGAASGTGGQAAGAFDMRRTGSIERNIMNKRLLRDSLGWGLALWFIGYVLGIILFFLLPARLIGWAIMPIGLLITF